MKRRCNECTLCCKLLPVRELGKSANASCKFQRSTGCRVHSDKLLFPRSCRLWSCVWLTDESIDVPRPDRAHYVIDPSPEFIEIEGHAVSVIQIWCDPRFPDAHRDPALRAWLSMRADQRQQIGLVRFDSMRAIALLPPQLTGGDWLEKAGTSTTEHSARDIVETLTAGPFAKGRA